MSMLLTIFALGLGAMGPEHSHEHSPQLGKLTFETSCSPAAQALFQQGAGWLHSFEYRRAAETFGQAAAADPACGIADWGVAMSYYHPLWDGPTPAELEKGKAALQKAKAVGAKSERERDSISRPAHLVTRTRWSGCTIATRMTTKRPSSMRSRLSRRERWTAIMASPGRSGPAYC